MCDAPRYLPNPNRGLHKDIKFKGIKSPVKYATDNPNVLKDCTSAFIKVPCGVCHSCIALKQSYIVQRAQLVDMDYQFFFCTFTYNENLPVTFVNDRRITYADVRHIQDFIRRVKLRGILPNNIKYLAVSERGGKTHRPHWHLLIAIPNEHFTNLTPAYLDYYGRKLHQPFLDNWVINKGSRKNPIYKPLCTYFRKGRRTNFSVEWVNPYYSNNGSSDVAFYVTKYVLKFDKYAKKLHSALKLNLPPDQFEEVWKLVKNHTLMSKHFGESDSEKVINHVRKGIDFAKCNNIPYPVFINPNTGQTFPLSPYLKQKYFTLDDAYYYYYRDNANTVDTIRDPVKDVDIQRFDRMKAKFDKTLDLLDNINSSEDGIY